MSSIKTVYPAQTNGGTVTQFIPLTSVFTYPSACSKSLLLAGNTLEAFNPDYDSLVSTMSCVPPAALSSAFAPDQEKLVPTVVSLGPFTCPRSWATLSKTTKDESSFYAACCPPGYNTLTGAFCLSDITKSEVLTFASASEKEGTAKWSIVTSTAGEDFQIVASAMWGWNIASSTSSSTSSVPSATSSNSSPVGGTGRTSPTGAPTTKETTSNGLSTGAKAAIGVCVPLVAILLIALLALFIRHHRKRAAAAAQDTAGNTSDPDKAESQPYGQKAELSGEGKQTGELPGHGAAEVPGSQTLPAELEMPLHRELAADQTVHELPATPPPPELPAVVS